jgi:hypothetical protein
VRHAQVQQDQVGIKPRVDRQHLAGVGGGDAVTVAGLIQDAVQQPHVGRLVVDDEQAGETGCRSHG